VYRRFKILKFRFNRCRYSWVDRARKRGISDIFLYLLASVDASLVRLGIRAVVAAIRQTERL
jgi:hypothetical protein